MRIAAFAAAAAVMAGVAACTAGQLATVDSLCAEAAPLAQLATPIPTVGPFIAAGVQIGCMTADGLAKLKADPSSPEWLAKQIGLLRGALG